MDLFNEEILLSKKGANIKIQKIFPKRKLDTSFCHYCNENVY